MTRVSQEHVIKRWLELECRKPEVPSVDVDSLTEREALDALLNAKPGAASFIWREAPIEWQKLTLSRHSFERLRVVAGPGQLSWRALSPDETIRGAANRIVACASEDVDGLTAETGVDIERVLSFSNRLPDGPLVLVDHPDCRPPRVADGNYRATARALNLIETDVYTPVRAYLGVPTRSTLKPLRNRLCELVRRRCRRTW
ncbi:hypothetical protein [Haladaptatus sp. DFWS20]|uniref:hypothetical protein n=1 Tax=Haladaptatus sp. DFWS20 TaxID=3403467 RepID=UPI003EBC0F7F